MKISMVTLHKEFYKRKWLRIDGDDSVRMLLTVHDEVVFEIKHERVVEAIPVIVEIMERPGKLASPPWKIPLIVEPLVGPNWGTGYKCERYVDYVKKCERMKKEPKLHEGDVLVNGFIYGVIREVEHKVDKEKKKCFIRITDPAWLRGIAPTFPTSAGTPVQTKTDDVAAPAVAAPTPPPAATSAAPPPPAATPATEAPKAPPPLAVPVTPPVAAAPRPGSPIVSIRISRLTKETVLQVCKAIIEADDSEGPVLKLMDRVGVTIIDPGMNIRINAKQFAEILDKQYNISNGRFDLEQT